MTDDNKNFGEGSEGSFDKDNQKSNEFGDKARREFNKAKDASKGFADESRKAANEFSEGARRTADEFSAGAKDAFNTVGGENKKILAGVLAILLGSLGIHKFILGYQKEGIILLVSTLIGYATLCILIGGFIVTATMIIGLVEGIIYLTKTDEEFYATYQLGSKPWF